MATGSGHPKEVIGQCIVWFSPEYRIASDVTLQFEFCSRAIHQILNRVLKYDEVDYLTRHVSLSTVLIEVRIVL